MKKVMKLLGVFILTTLLAFTSPVMAQTADNGTTTTTTTDDDDDDGDSGKWGLLGLLGLLGLAGLKRRDDDKRTSVNR